MLFRSLFSPLLSSPLLSSPLLLIQMGLQASHWMRGIKWSLLANTERPPYIPNMPLMPEERDGAGIEDEQRSAAENAAVADRYRLYGRHFVARSKHRDTGGTAVANGLIAAVSSSDPEDANPFAGPR